MVRVSALGVVGLGFTPQPLHTKGGKNGTGSSIADAHNKRVVPGRYKKAGTAGILLRIFEPRSEKTGLRGFRPGLTQTGVYSHIRWLED